MVTHDRSTHFETSRVSELYRKLAAAVRVLSLDRQKALMENLEVKDLADVLRKAIKNSGLTHYRIAKDAGIAPDVLDRFMQGKDIRLTTAAKVANVLKLKLVPDKRGSK